MTDLFFSDPRIVERLHEGPLGLHIDAFAALLVEQGYAKSTAKEKVQLVGDLSHWLHRRGISVEGLEGEVARFLRYRRKQSRFRRGDPPTLQQLLKYLRGARIIPSPRVETKLSPLDLLASAFVRYLEEVRGLARATVDNYLPTVRHFLSERFGTGRILLRRIVPQDITKFILRHAHTVSPRRAQLMVAGLRSFLRFAHQRGETTTDLTGCVPTVARWRFAELPKFLQPQEVELLLESCDQGTAIGQRDYAVLLLLARLGLRAGEVVNVLLADIVWETGELIVRGKSPREERLPIPQDVGEALAAYLRHGRPRCSSRRVFIRMQAPHEGFSSSVAICDIVRRALSRAGLSPARKGAHLLRHSLATKMLRSGATLGEIGEILRHELPNTTEIYTKVDLSALRALAQPWPGGEI
jgi:site-specific recombinase XerD